MIVAVGGVPGSGKTEVVYYLRAELYRRKIKSLVLHVDDYYKVAEPGRRDLIRRQQRKIGLCEIDIPEIQDTIDLFLEV